MRFKLLITTYKMKNWIQRTLLVCCIFCLAGARAAEAPKADSELKGLIIVNSEQAILKEGDPALAVTGLQVKDVEMLKGEAFAARVKPLFGKTINEATLKEIQTAILGHYRSQGFPLADAIFPPQTVANGVLQVIVIESKLGKVTFEGTNKWTSTDHIRKNLHVTEGERINEPGILSDVAWLNRNRFRSTDVFYKPGESKLESDLVVRTTERYPLGGSVGFDNSGNRLTGENRFYAGVEWGKAFGLTDHLLTYRYTTDAEFDFLKAHSASYSIPFPWHHTLTLSGSYADVKGNIPNSPLTQAGTTYQLAMRYEIELPRIHAYRHQLSLGFDFRHLDNNLEFNSTNILADTTEIAQAVVGYTGLLPDSFGSTFLGAEFNYSPGNLTDRNKDEFFKASNPYAEANYQYARFNLDRVTRLPARSSWRVSGAYQLTDGNLVPSEQFGLGGSYTVRGYEERSSSGGEGFLVSNELRLPTFSPGRWLDKGTKDELQVIGFFDYGETSNRLLQRGEDKHVQLMSAGAGLRFRVSHYLSVRFDYGWQLIHVPTDPSRSRGHLSAMFTY
jgi:hemolysin activation/secretion protein